jgi:2-polyprenyl-6-methoxyphenol hydroxylase-like FAD-dependent oxidoreductase
MEIISGQPRRRALVVGLGISGITAALQLRRIGWEPVIVEKAPRRRSGGYFVGLFGAGKAAADRLGLLDGLHDRTPAATHLDLDRSGSRGAALSFRDLPGLPWLMVRGDVEQAAFEKLPHDVEIFYSTVPTEIEQDADGVDVTLVNIKDQSVTTERFELVVGADGLRSTVRSLVFGPHSAYLRRLNHMIAAFEVPGTLGDLGRGQGGTLLEPGRSMWVFAFSDHNPTVLLSYASGDVDAEFLEPPAQRIRRVFGPEPLGRTLAAAVTALETADDLLFDSVEQVRMDQWHRGRVVLVGDAAWCVCLYAGMGVSAGLSGADMLGMMLERHPDDMKRAFCEWERKLRPYIDYYQRIGIEQRQFFTPDSHRRIAVRRAMARLNAGTAGRVLHYVNARTKATRMKEVDIAGT